MAAKKRSTAKKGSAKKQVATKPTAQAEGDRVNASIEASRAAAETHLVELNSDELATVNREHGSAVERPGLTPRTE